MLSLLLGWATSIWCGLLEGFGGGKLAEIAPHARVRRGRCSGCQFSFTICSVGIGAPHLEGQKKKLIGFEVVYKGDARKKEVLWNVWPWVKRPSREHITCIRKWCRVEIPQGCVSGCVWDLLKPTSIWGSYQSRFNKEAEPVGNTFKSICIARNWFRQLWGQVGKSKTQRAGYQEGQTGDTAVPRRNSSSSGSNSALKTCPSVSWSHPDYGNVPCLKSTGYRPYTHVCLCAESLQLWCQLFAPLWTIAWQAPLLHGILEASC